MCYSDFTRHMFYVIYTVLVARDYEDLWMNVPYASLRSHFSSKKLKTEPAYISLSDYMKNQGLLTILYNLSVFSLTKNKDKADPAKLPT